MEFWEVTKQRAQESLPVWKHHVPELTIGVQGVAALKGYIDQFEPVLQKRTEAQDDYDHAYRTVQDTLAKMKLLGTRVPKMIEAQLEENRQLMRDLQVLYRTTMRGEATILKRARELYSVWLRADAAMAALTPPQPPITRVIQGVAYGVTSLLAMLDGYTLMIKAVSDTRDALDTVRRDLRDLDEATDQLNKRWYMCVKAAHDEGSAVFHALEGITTEPTTPAPKIIEIKGVVQGGERGMEVLVDYLPGGGDHATRKEIKWMVVNVDEDFIHSAPLEEQGNALGSFTVGQVVRVIVEVGNSVATRTSAPRTITIGQPIG